MDLTTSQGRLDAVKGYKNFLRKATDAQVIAGHNVQFDVQRIMMSISGLDEFHQDQEAVELLSKFQKMSDEGRVINSLDLARDYLTRQALDIAESGAPDDIAKTQRLISTMFAPETLTRASIGGSATPFSVGNITAQTNLLKLIADQGKDGSDFVKQLASGTHRADIDTNLTNYMMNFIHTGELKFGFEATGSSAADISIARKEILKASAIVPTTNIADVQHMSDAVFKYATSEEGLQSTKLSTADGIIAFSKSDNEFYEHVLDPVTGKVEQNKISDQIAVRQRIRNALDASRRNQDSELLETGINYLQASRTDRILQNVSKVSSISSAATPDALIAAISSGTDTALDDAFIDAMAGTREFLGYNNYNYRPDILADKGMTGFMSRNYGMISDTAADNYLNKLASAGIATAVDDPYMRRNFVELATITSSTPFRNKVEGYTGGLAGKLTRNIFAKARGMGPLTEAEHASRVAEFNSNVGIRVGDYLSEMGISFADTQNTMNIIGKGIGPDGTPSIASRVIVSSDILKDIDVSIADGAGGRKTVKFLSDDFLSDYGQNKFGLSVAERKDSRVVNLVFGDLAADANSGQRVVSRRKSLELARGIVDQMQNKFSGQTAAQLVEQGHFETAQEASTVLEKLRGGKEGVRALRKDIARSISERGLVVGSIAGREGEGVAALLEQLAGGIDNDTEAFRKGMQFAISEYGDDFVAFQGRIDEKVIGALRQSNPTLAKEIEEGKFLKRAYKTYQASMERAAEDTGFRKKLQRAFSSKGLDKGIFGSRFGRSLRDAEVRAMYRKVAPKVGIGAAAVGLLGAGYYIAKKNREKDLYDQVMEEQPIEGRGTVSSSNYDTIEQNSQYSSRRDPLVTAGVVGNLDRNKIGHTTMGPNKYNHLYG